MYLSLLAVIASALPILAAGEPPSPVSITAPGHLGPQVIFNPASNPNAASMKVVTHYFPASAHHHDALNSTLLSKDDSNTGNCSDGSGLIMVPWPGKPLVGKEACCNTAFNNVTRKCCDEMRRESRLGHCGLYTCKVYNCIDRDELQDCFSRYVPASGCYMPVNDTPDKSWAAGRPIARLAATALAGLNALGISF